MLKVYHTYVAAHAVHLPSTVVRAIFAAVAGISPPPLAAPAESSFHEDYHFVLTLLLRCTTGQYTSPLSAESQWLQRHPEAGSCRGMPADAEQALRHEWLAWLTEGLAPLGRAQPL